MNKYEDEEILHVKNGELEYLQFKALNKYNVLHCITLRHGGVSTNEHSSLNFRNKGTDKAIKSEDWFNTGEICRKVLYPKT